MFSSVSVCTFPTGVQWVCCSHGRTPSIHAEHPPWAVMSYHCSLTATLGWAPRVAQG